MKLLVKRIRHFWYFWDAFAGEEICKLPDEEFEDILKHRWKQIPYYIKNFSLSYFKMAWEIPESNLY